MNLTDQQERQESESKDPVAQMARNNVRVLHSFRIPYLKSGVTDQRILEMLCPSIRSRWSLTQDDKALKRSGLCSPF